MDWELSANYSLRQQWCSNKKTNVYLHKACNLSIGSK